MKRALVIGYGISGKASCQFLKHLGYEAIAVDKRGGEVPLDLPDFPLDDFDLVILSPGIAPSHPLAQKALSLKIELISEIELGFRHLEAHLVFGITGTNGKTTTVLLAEHILNGAGKKAKALGNVGKSLTEYLVHPDPNEILIIELSSFQLQMLQSRKLDVGIILNITPNHLDRHASFDEYVMAKARIGCCLKEGGELYVSKQLMHLFPNAKNFEKNLAPLNEVSYTQLVMPSKQSIEAAYLLCKRCGVTDLEFLKHLETFRKPSHRIEWVAKINGVSYYDDSKSSNIQSVMHAVEQFSGPLVLIVGGVHKGSSYKPWVEPFKEKVKLIIAYGQAAPIIEYELKAHFQLHVVDRFSEAVRFAKLRAKEDETVLLSPGCSSFDQFENYQHRGVEFKRLVREEP